MAQKSHSSQRGAALILFSILVIAILVGIALGIDIFIAATSKNQHFHTAEQASLAAMEAYISYDESSCTQANGCCALGPCTVGESNVARQKAAAANAGSIVDANKNLWLGSSFFVDPLLPQGDLGIKGSPGANGYTEGGNWYFDDPGCTSGVPFTGQSLVSSPSCPCDSNNAHEWQQPCFEPLANDTQGNSIKIHLNLHNGSPISTVFASLIGTDSVTLRSQAIVAETPRRGVFLLDISGSIVKDSHGWGYKVANISQRDFLNALQPKAGVTASHLDDPSAWLISDFDTNSFIGWLVSGDSTTDPGGQCSGASTPALCHYPTDYTYFEGIDYGNGIVIPDHVIENDLTKPPEPLSAILDAVHEALERFSDRSVGGDRVGVVAFDDEVMLTRATNDCYPTLAAPGCDFSLIEPTSANPKFQRWERATDTSLMLDQRLSKNALGGEELDLYLFPRSTGNVIYQAQKFHDTNANGVFDVGELADEGLVTDIAAPFTDIHRGLMKALEMIESEPGARSAQNFVVVFSDGKTNCKKNSAPASIAERMSDYATNTNHSQELNTRCWNMQEFYTAGIANIDADVIQEFEKNNVSFHMVIAGDSVAPHNLVRKGADGCMTDEEAKNTPAGLNRYTQFTDPGASLISDSVFYGPNELWNFTERTNGSWVPIRPACKVDGVGVGIDISGSFNTKCDAIGGSVGDLILPGAIPGNIGGINPNAMIDGSGRLLCDPAGRDVNTQLQDAINDIMSVTPYVLVEELD